MVLQGKEFFTKSDVGGGHLNVERRKLTILFLVLFVLFILGCNRAREVPSRNSVTETPPENSIPFLTFSFNQKTANMEAYLNYWDIVKGKIITTDKVLYITPYISPPNQTTRYNLRGLATYYALPLSWDGKSYIYLSSRIHEPKNIPNYFKLKMFDDPVDPDKWVKGREILYDYVYTYSKNLQVQEKNVGAEYLYSKAKYGDFTFRVFDNGGNLVLKKNEKISLYNDVFHGGVSSGEACLYEEDKKEVKELLLYYDSVGMGHFLICTINLEKDTYRWDEVSGIEHGCIPNMNQQDVSIIGNKFYVPLCGCYIGIIDPDEYTCKLLDQQEIFKSLSFYNSPTGIHYGGYPQIPGEYNDYLILNGTIDYGKNKDEEFLSDNYKHIWIAYNTKIGKIDGILEWYSLNPQFIILRDRDGKELYRIETDKLVKDVSKLYDVSGNSYINGRFIYENFIRFPHINGG